MHARVDSARERTLILRLIISPCPLGSCTSESWHQRAWTTPKAHPITSCVGCHCTFWGGSACLHSSPSLVPRFPLVRRQPYSRIASSVLRGIFHQLCLVATCNSCPAATVFLIPRFPFATRPRKCRMRVFMSSLIVHRMASLPGKQRLSTSSPSLPPLGPSS